MPNPWDRPPWPESGEDECEVIFLAVGRALNNWSEAEECVSDLFVFFVGPDAHNSPAVRAYSSIDGVRNRVKMVRHAADAWFKRFTSCPLKERTLDLLRACEEWSNRRNEIAHGIVDLPVDTPGASWFLYPGNFTTRRTHGNDAEFRYTADQVEKLADGFLSLEIQLSELIQSFEDWRETNL